MLWLMPAPTDTLSTFTVRAAIGSIPGEIVLSLAFLFALGLVIISVGTVGMQRAAGEVLPRFLASDTSGRKRGHERAWFRPSHRRPQLLTLIITDQPQLIADQVLKNMSRGVTGMDGTGMFTGAKHTVLICAMTITEIPQLKAIVAQADPNAFVIVSPAQEIFGKGFFPLQDED